MRLIIFINASILVLGACLMALDALFFRETAGLFAEAALMTGALGLMLGVASWSSTPEIATRETFLLTASVWITAALFGMLPLYMWELSFTDAFFESMSGITTTGSTVMSGLDSTPRGILFWRAVLQWMGGIGFIVTGMALLPILKVGGMQLFRTESSDQGEKLLKSSALYAAATASVYIGLTLACMLAYHAGGMSIFDAVVHGLTTLSSGGYSNYDASFGHFQSHTLQWTATLFMLCAGIPFAWFILAFQKGRFASEQVRAYLLLLAVVIVLLTLWRVMVRGAGLEESLRLVAFNVVSAVTTTGYATADYTTWGGTATVAFFLLTAMGGCTGSTAGGAKMMRWIVLARAVHQRLRQLRFPHGIFPIRYEGRRLEANVLDGVVAFFIFYILTIGVLAVLLGLIGLDFSTATSGALTAVANVGPGVGEIIGPAGNFAPLPDSAKWLIAAGMYLGRLEMMTVYALLTPVFWRGL